MAAQSGFGEKNQAMKTARVCASCHVELPTESPLALCPQCLKEQTTAITEQPTASASSRFDPPHPDALQSLFPQLDIFGLLGTGGMGVVYRARQRGLDRLVALKVLPPRFAGDPAFAERFAREARMLARLNHPNIVDVYDLGRAGQLYYFLMEFVGGVSLRQMLLSHRLTPPEALAIASQVCEALEYAHGEGIVHRDIKPENILLDQKGRVKIADFGVSKLLGASPTAVQLTQSSQVLGTFHYMAPEQFQNPLAVDHRVDLYSLGVVLYEMLTGELPLGRFSLPSRMAAVDARLDELVLRTLEKDPSRRYQHASDLRVQVEALAGAPSKLTPEVRRKLSFEYRSKTTLFGWPLVHVATGVDPATGRTRIAKGIIAIGDTPRGVIAFGYVAVGVIAIGIFGYGLFSISIIAVGAVALGPVAVGLGLAIGGVAVAPVALGGSAAGYYATGGLAWGRHALSPRVYDPIAEKFFSPRTTGLMMWAARAGLVAMPLFLALGFLPNLMAKLAERQRQRHLRSAASSRR
jgi:predicted Ser/Thr protein kinase